jgi:hypothetical protein
MRGIDLVRLFIRKSSASPGRVIVWVYGATVVDMALVIRQTQPPVYAVIAEPISATRDFHQRARRGGAVADRPVGGNRGLGPVAACGDRCAA